MSNKNGRDRKRDYENIKKRDGAYCRGCQALESERELIIHHKDNNNSNNSYSNLILLCRKCNYMVHPRLSEREPLDVCGGGCDSLDRETEITINREKEPKFRKYVELRVGEEKQVPQQDLIHSGAEYCGCSPKTTRRYLDKLISIEGRYQKRKDGNITIIYLKEESGMI